MLVWVLKAPASNQPVVLAATVAVPMPLRVCIWVRTGESPLMMARETSFLSDNITLRILLSRMDTTAKSPLLAAFSTADSTMGWVKLAYSYLAKLKGSVTAIETGSKPLLSSVIVE